MRYVLPLFLLLAAGVACLAGDTLDQGLSMLGVDREHFRVPAEELLTRDGGPYRLGIFDQWFGHPLRIPRWEGHLRDGLLASRGHLHSLFESVSATLDIGTRRDLIPPTPLEHFQKLAAAPNALASAIHALDKRAKVENLREVPPEVQKMAAMLLFAAADALKWRELALRNLSQNERTTLYSALTEPLMHPDKEPAPEESGPFDVAYYRQQELLAKIDLSLLYAGADDLTDALDAASAELTKTPVTAKYRFSCHTHLGDIILAGGADDSYPDKRHYLLILDTSGNNTYAAGGATGGVDYPLGIIIDAGGKSQFAAKGNKPAFGAGIMGYGMLLHLTGSGTFTCPGFYTEGCGIAGVGLLADAAGHGTYSAMGGAQGFGLFGVGILASAGGNNTYNAYTYSQGCGLTRGFGLLFDLLGNDKYTANDTDILFPSAQSKSHNTSMCQGAGSGDRRDYLDGHSSCGGVGMLLNGAGHNQYYGGVFTQAVGYWYGIGILDDRGGNSSYRGVWYAQSATAHFGVSYLDSGGGGNTFTVTNCVSNGAAHDFSASLFVIEGGNNVYDIPGSGLGEALNCSVALFADLGGNNTYRAGGGAYGSSVNFVSTGLRADIPTLALFLSLGGNNHYPPGIPPGAAKTWQQEVKSPLPLLHGAGVDVAGGSFNWD